jgi:hypothetical protein
MSEINKDKLLKYGEYLKETIDPWKLKQGIKSFNRLSDETLTIYGDLKDLSIELTKEFENINLPYDKLLNFGGIEVDIKIIQSNRYYSNIDWMKFLKGDYEIIIETEQNYDINYVISTIIHEIRHMIDFTDENLNNGLSSFDVDRNLRKYNINVFNEFFTLVYISLEHELVARNNQIYPYIKFKNLKKEQSIEILKQSFIWKALEMLNSFDYNSFIVKFDQDVLINVTNNFIKDCLYDNESHIENIDEIKSFYKIWDEYFREVSEKWKNILLKEVDMVYERKVNPIYESSGHKDILNDIWKKLKYKS